MPGPGNTEEIVINADIEPARRQIEGPNGLIKLTEKWGDVAVRVTDRSKNSVDRLVVSMMKQAEVYGKTGVEKLVAQRDLLVARYGNEQRAVEAITKSYNMMIDVERKLIDQKRLEEEASKRASEQMKREAEEAKRSAEMQSHFSPRFTMLMTKDLFEGRGTFAAAEGFNLLSGLKGIPLLAGSAVAAIGGIMLAARSASEHVGQFGEEMHNLHLRTGIAVADLNQFVFAAKAVGQDASVYERMMRGLSQALGENSKEGDKARTALSRLGVDVRDKLTGEAFETTTVLLNISKALDTLPAGFQRDAAAMDLMKKAGIETIPVLEGLAERVKRANELGLGVTDEEVKRWETIHQKMEETSAEWDRIKLRIAEPLATVWTITVKIADAATTKGSVKATGFGGLGMALGGILGSTAFGIGAVPGAAIGGVAGVGASELSDWMFPDKKPYEKQGPAYDPEYARKVLQRGQADEYIRSVKAVQSPEEKLQAAQAELAKLVRPVEGITSLDEAKAYRTAQQKVEQLKEQIKYTHELTEAQKRLQSFENAMNQRDLTPLQKLDEQLRDFLAPREGQAPFSASQRNSATAVTEAAKERERRKEATELAKEFSRVMTEAMDILTRHSVEALNTQGKLLGSFAEDDIKKGILEYQQAQNRIKEGDRENLDRYSLNVHHIGRMGAISSQREGTVAELSAVKEEFAIRQQIRDQERAMVDAHQEAYNIDKDGLGAAKERARIELESTKDRYEVEEKIAEIKKKEIDEVQKTTQGLLKTLFTKPGDFGKQLSGTMRDAVLSPITRGMSQVIAGAVTPIIFGKNGQSGINGVLSGLFGGTPKAIGSSPSNPMYVVSVGPGTGGGGTWSPAMGGTNFSSVLFGGGQQASMGGVGVPMGNGGFLGSILGGGGSNNGSSFMPGESGGMPTGSGGGFGGLGGIFGGGGNGSGGIFSGLSGGKGILGNLGGIFGNLKGSLGGLIRSPGSWSSSSGADGGDAPDSGTFSPGHITGVGGLAGTGLMMGGMFLGMRGLLGKDRGTGKGVLEGTAGGAMIGMKMGGPIGAAIGAGVGLGIGLGEMLAGVESPEHEAQRLIKQIYGVSIDMKMAQQIVSIAQQKYANHVSLAVRDPEVRNMLSVYAAGTGQKIPLSATTPRAGSLVEQNGGLYQQASYVMGHAYSFQSSLPVAGGMATGTYASPSSITLNVNGQSAADLLEGRIANTVTPGYVQSAYSSSLSASNGRTANAAMIQQPGLVTM